MLDLKERLEPGMGEVVQKPVTAADTAVNYGGGMLGELLATPAYVDLMIKAAVETVDKHLPEGFTTVGRSMSFTHEAPTVLGMTVSVQATLVRIDGNHLYFEITAFDEVGEIGRGQHERAVVNRGQLLKRAKERAALVAKSYIK